MNLFFSFLFVGCPEPISENQANIDATETKDIKDKTDQGGGSVSDINGKAIPKLDGAPPTMGTFPGNMAANELKPKYTQKELQEGGVINGYVRCDDCTGKLLIRVLPPPPDANGSGGKEDMQLITQAIIDKAGAFTVYVPNESKVVLQVVDDANNDGAPSQGERMGMRGSGPLDVSGTVDGIELTVGVFPQKENVTNIATPPVAGKVENPEGVEGEPPKDNGANPPPNGQIVNPPPEGGVVPNPPPEGGQPPTPPSDGSQNPQ